MLGKRVYVVDFSGSGGNFLGFTGGLTRYIDPDGGGDWYLYFGGGLFLGQGGSGALQFGKSDAVNESQREGLTGAAGGTILSPFPWVNLTGEIVMAGETKSHIGGVAIGKGRDIEVHVMFEGNWKIYDSDPFEYDYGQLMGIPELSQQVY